MEEIPAYGPSGTGDHLFVWIEKRGVGTHAVIRQLAARLGVARDSIGRAGLKDARAVTRQMLSVPDVTYEDVARIQLDGAQVLWGEPHGRKLRVGHLRGNRFRIRLRDVDPTRSSVVNDVILRLRSRGVPNYFGRQRFGARGDTWLVGRAVLRSLPEEALGQLCGRPDRGETPRLERARTLFDEGQYKAAAELWPRDFAHCAGVCRSLARGDDAARAMGAVDRSMVRFTVSAYQSWLFNAVIAERIDEIDEVREGDLAMKHENGAVFRVEQPTVEAARVAAFEISPTGPLFGPRMTQPDAAIAALEYEAAQRAGGDVDDLSSGRLTRRLGGRRALRVPVEGLASEEGEDSKGPFVELRFQLPAGSYATAVLREIGKERLVDMGSLAARGAERGRGGDGRRPGD